MVPSSLSVFSTEAEKLPFKAPSANGYFSSVPSTQKQPHSAPGQWQGMGGRAVGPPWALPIVTLVTDQVLHGCCSYTHKALTETLLCLWSLSPISSSVSSSFTFPNFPRLSHLNVFFSCQCTCSEHLWLSVTDTSAPVFPMCAVLSSFIFCRFCLLS